MDSAYSTSSLTGLVSSNLKFVIPPLRAAIPKLGKWTCMTYEGSRLAQGESGESFFHIYRFFILNINNVLNKIGIYSAIFILCIFSI